MSKAVSGKRTGGDQQRARDSGCVYIRPVDTRANQAPPSRVGDFRFSPQNDAFPPAVLACETWPALTAGGGRIGWGHTCCGAAAALVANDNPTMTTEMHAGGPSCRVQRLVPMRQDPADPQRRLKSSHYVIPLAILTCVSLEATAFPVLRDVKAGRSTWDRPHAAPSLSTELWKPGNYIDKLAIRWTVRRYFTSCLEASNWNCITKATASNDVQNIAAFWLTSYENGKLYAIIV
ncbi:hypothetical protein F4859DRAFT_520441 [Xylaria cf. heliscus]|nr:hypothetical protein F4859DRAFT_520441 [Xylaria cf. heliscus]